MKFIVDHMLGRLAKWLRILGYDSLFLTNTVDSEILKIASLENRTLLTRDRELSKKAGAVKSILIQSNRYPQQLKEVISVFGIDWNDKALFSICLECNEPIEMVEKKKSKTSFRRWF